MKISVLKSLGLRNYWREGSCWQNLPGALGQPCVFHAVGLQLHCLASVGFLQLVGKQCCILLETILTVNSNEHLGDFCISIIELRSTFNLRWGVEIRWQWPPLLVSVFGCLGSIGNAVTPDQKATAVNFEGCVELLKHYPGITACKKSPLWAERVTNWCLFGWKQSRRVRLTSVVMLIWLTTFSGAKGRSLFWHCFVLLSF